MPERKVYLAIRRIVDSGGLLQQWNMWNGRHLIEAIDLVLLNSLAYNNNGNANDKEQLRTETESLRKVLWDGVNGMLKEGLQPHERREHLPARRSPNSEFVKKVV